MPGIRLGSAGPSLVSASSCHRPGDGIARHEQVLDRPPRADLLEHHVARTIQPGGRNGSDKGVGGRVDTRVRDAARSLVALIQRRDEVRAPAHLPARGGAFVAPARLPVGNSASMVGRRETDVVVHVDPRWEVLDCPPGNQASLAVSDDVHLRAGAGGHHLDGPRDVFGRYLDVSQSTVGKLHPADLEAGRLKSRPVSPAPILFPGHRGAVNEQHRFGAAAPVRGWPVTRALQRIIECRKGH